MNSPRNVIYLVVATALMLLCLPAQTVAQVVVANIPLGQRPTSIAVNSQTNTVYATCQSPTTLKVVDGGTNTLTATIPLNSIFFPPVGIAANATTNRVYVDDFVHGVWVLDGATNAVLAVVNLPIGVVKIAVNPVTNLVYVGNKEERSITVIDGDANSPTENSVIGVIPMPSYFGGDLVVNPVTNRLYVVTNAFDFETNKFRSLTVIDGSTNTVIASPLNDVFPGSLGVNPVTNKAYMVNGSGNFKLEVFDAAVASHLTTVTLNFGLNRLAVNPTTNRIHITEPDLGAIWTIDGSNNTFIRYGLNLHKPFPGPLAVNPVTSFVYVANGGSEPLHGGQSISVIDDPPAPVVQFHALIEMVSAYNLANGISNSLDSKLQNALAALESLNSGPNGTVCNKLDAFINEVESHKELTTAQTNDLISAAVRIKRTLGCAV
jgi:DNA-binding beta-propeller fold protein YncE